MLNIEDFSINKARWPGGVVETSMVYAGKEYIYYITHAMIGSYYNLRICDTDGNGEPDTYDRYSCSSLSVAIANIEALERGEKI